MSSTYVVSIDSRDRNRATYPSAGRYTVKLPRIYGNVESVKLLDVQIPTSFYVFTSSNNSMIVNLYTAGGGTLADTQTVTLPIGNYTSTTFVAAVQQALDDAFTGIGIAFTVTLNPTTLKVSFENDLGYYIEFDTTTGVGDGGTDWGLGYYLGFNKNETTTPALAPTAPNTINLNPVTFLYLDIEPLNFIDVSGRDGTEGTQKHAFAKIPLPDVSFNIMYLDSKTVSFPPCELTPPLAKLERLHIAWKTYDGAIVDFNDTEHSFQLQLTCCDRTPGCQGGRVLNTAVNIN